MIIILFFVSAHSRIAYADGASQIFGEFFLRGLVVSGFKRITESMKGVSVLSGGILEPFGDLLGKYITDFFVGNGKDVFTLLRDASLCQIAGRKQQAPDIVNGIIHIVIGQVLTDRFIPASNEPSGHAGMSIWRLPRGSNTPMLASLLI